jgi:hypothetical protein
VRQFIVKANPEAGTFKITYDTTRIYLHELVLYCDYSAVEFQAPYPVEHMDTPVRCGKPEPATAEGVAIIIASAHSILQTFGEMSDDTVRALPAVAVVRVRYAAFILCKLFASASDPQSQLGQFVDAESLNLNYYLGLTVAKLRSAAEPLGFRRPRIFLTLLESYHNWYKQRIGLEGPVGTSVRGPDDDFDTPVLDNVSASDDTQQSPYDLDFEAPDIQLDLFDDYEKGLESMDFSVDDPMSSHMTSMWGTARAS